MALRRNKDGNLMTPHSVYVSEAQSKAAATYQQRQKDKLGFRVARQAARANRTPEEQLAVLDQKFGEGLGAKKERARLAKEIVDSQAKELV